MKQKELSLLDFQKRFRSERDCQQALLEARWPEGFICGACGHDCAYLLSRRPIMQCSLCRHQTSVTAGTIFHKTRIPLLIWFWMIYLVAQDKGGASASRLAKQLDIRYATVWSLLHKIRSAMTKREENIILDGLLEIDHAFFGRAATAKKPLKANNQSLALVMIERLGKRAGRLAISVVSSANRDSIRAIVERRVKPEQRIRSDGFSANYVMRSMGHRLTAKTLPAEKSCRELPWVHLAIALAKRFLLGTYHGVSSKYLQSYLDEFCYRFNRRASGNAHFTRLLNACILANPTNYAVLFE
jgi:transposase-like protein